MLIYEELPEEFRNAANCYGLSGEITRISGPVTYENNTFYEIEFIKKSFFNLKKSTTGIIIIDRQGNAVESREMIRALLKMFYYYKLFFYSYKKDFGSALKSEEQLKAEEQEYQEASDAARCLMDEGTDGAGSVKFIIDKLPIMRREANDILRTFLENIDNYKEAGIFNREIFEELMDIYDRVMLMSFQRVKFINNASVFYNGIRRNLVSRKGKLKSRIGAKNQGELAKLETILSFFINILGYYKEVISYPEDRYIKYVHNKDSEEIDKVYHLVRNIK